MSEDYTVDFSKKLCVYCKRYERLPGKEYCGPCRDEAEAALPDYD